MNSILVLGTIIFAFIILFFWFKKQIESIQEKIKPDNTLIEWLKSNQQTIEQTNKNIAQVLHQSTQSLNERLDNAAKVIGDVQKNIGEMSEIGRSMKQLQEFLSSPKLRGNIGEQVLKELLGQTLPKSSFHLQYTFKSGAIVDAAVKTTAGIIPIDSKFPMENFKKLNAAENEKEKEAYRRIFLKDVKKHIRDISKKYILTEEGTLDYALMYIPSEAIYYEVINSDPKLLDFAHDKKVLPVSPATFYAYLKAILMSFEGQKIEIRARQIIRTIQALKKDYENVETYLSTLNKHLNNAYNQMNNVMSSFNLLGQKITITASLPEPEDKKKLETLLKNKKCYYRV